eukprot:Hpha_TRINITY_DN16816_c1_g8::TRINITY_DN16816_c1_g8_i1::g.151990::m.151990
MAADRKASAGPTGAVSRIRSYLRIRPYSPDEKAGLQSASLDASLSGVELDEEQNRIILREPGEIAMRGANVPHPPANLRRKDFTPSGFEGFLWSFNVDPWKLSGGRKTFKDDVNHEFMDQSGVWSAVGAEGMVRGVYDGLNQSLIVHGGAGTGKTHTMFGDSADPGVAPRMLDALWAKRADVPASEGEEVHVQLSVVLLRIFMESVEDVTQACLGGGRPAAPSPGTSSRPTPGSMRKAPSGKGSMLGGDSAMEGARKLDIRADGTFPREAVQSFEIHSDGDVVAAKQAMVRLSRRRERRAHAVVIIRCRQTSTFQGEDEEEQELEDAVWVDGDVKAAKAGRWASVTLVDVGAGKKGADERDDRGLMPKSRFELSQTMRALKQKSTVEDEYEENMRLYQGVAREGAAKAPRVQYNASKLTQLLQEQLGGNCSTVVVCCASPYVGARQDTLDTIEFGRLAQGVRGRVKRNQQEALTKLRNVAQQKERMVRMIHKENQNVVLVMNELRDRRLRVEEEEERAQFNDQVMANRERDLSQITKEHKTMAGDLQVYKRHRTGGRVLERLGSDVSALQVRLIRAQAAMGTIRAETDLTQNRGALLVELCVLASALVSEIDELTVLSQRATGDSVEFLKDGAWLRSTITRVPGEHPSKYVQGCVVTAGPASGARRGTIMSEVDEDDNVWVRWWDRGAGAEEEEESSGALFLMPTPSPEALVRNGLEVVELGKFTVSSSTHTGDFEETVEGKEIAKRLRGWAPVVREDRLGSLIRLRAPHCRDAPRMPRNPAETPGLSLGEAAAEYAQEVALARRALVEDGGMARWPPRPLKDVLTVLDISFKRELKDILKATPSEKLRAVFDRATEEAAQTPPSVERAIQAEKDASQLTSAASRSGAWPPPKALRSWLAELSTQLLPGARDLWQGKPPRKTPGLFSASASAREVKKWSETVQIAAAVVLATRMRLEAVVDVESRRAAAERIASDVYGLFRDVAASTDPLQQLAKVEAHKRKTVEDIERLKGGMDAARQSLEQAKRQTESLSAMEKQRQEQAKKAASGGGCTVS